MGAGSHNDNFGLGWGNTDLNTGVTIFGQFTSQKLVKFGLEDTIGDKLENKFGERLVAYSVGISILHNSVFLEFKERVIHGTSVCNFNLRIHFAFSKHFTRQVSR